MQIVIIDLEAKNLFSYNLLLHGKNCFVNLIVKAARHPFPLSPGRHLVEPYSSSVSCARFGSHPSTTSNLKKNEKINELWIEARQKLKTSHMYIPKMTFR